MLVATPNLVWPDPYFGLALTVGVQALEQDLIGTMLGKEVCLIALANGHLQTRINFFTTFQRGIIISV